MGKVEFDLTGKVALITGSTTGIGEACARALSAAGASVVVHGRNAERGKRLADALSKNGRESIFLAADFRSSSVCDKLVADTVKHFGELNILVNNAGILHGGTAPETTDEQWYETMQVNVTSLFFMSRAAVRQMMSQGGGGIVNIASEWGINGENGYVAYCASKGAVVQITRCMALDHAADNIRVNSVCPGDVHTQMTEEMPAKSGITLEQVAAGIPMRRLATPSEVANCVLFLASDLASYVTGANLSVDGGNDASAGQYP